MAENIRHDLPLIAPRPPRLSEMTAELRALEASGLFSNGGPNVRAFEAEATARLFGGIGDSLAVVNATVGLMIAIREAAGDRRDGLALMPAFTFAATAQAAVWAGFTPLLCDSDRADWAAGAAAEDEALARYGDRIAVIVPYATFGEAIDLDRYRSLADRHGVGVVVDAAASLGTLDASGDGFASGTPLAAVFSMHATKTFAVAEGGLIHSADPERIARLRRMTNFGFGDTRSAIMPGLNAKLPEVIGLMARAKLAEIDGIAAHRASLAGRYRELLGDDFTFQQVRAARQVSQFMPLLLPSALAERRSAIVARLADRGIGAAHYFSPHLGQQPWFRDHALAEPTPIADDIARRILSLPITDAMTMADVTTICTELHAASARPAPAAPRACSRPADCTTLLIGGGPAGTALLTAATKRDRLVALAAGLVVVDRGHTLGGGQLGSYAITSDSTAETFLSAVKDNVHADLAALTDHPSGREIARHIDALGVPLARTRPFLEATGERLGAIVAANGGGVIARHEVRASRRTAAGRWLSRLHDLDSGAERDVVSDNIVIATGGHQSPVHVGAEQVDGVPLAVRAGGRLILSDDALRLGGIDLLVARLGENRAPRIAIVGASTSALAAAALLLKSRLPLGAGAIGLLHRGPIRPFYPSADAARADGFDDFGDDDICPVSGFVYRLAGFRLEARDLVLRMLEVGGRVADPRLRFHRIAGDRDADAGALIDRADIVIAALGYRPNALPLLDVSGKRIELMAHAPGRPRMIDQSCRVIDADGRPLPGAYGIGLAAGFVPSGPLGGEPSFRGKANGLWLWQNDVGLLIVDQLLDVRARAAA